MSHDPYTSVVDVDCDEARTAARYAPDPWPEVARAEAEADQHGDDWLELVFDELHALPVRPGRGRQPRSAA